MVSVRCMRPGLPGGNSITAKRVPFSGGGVPMMRAPRSSTSSPTAQSAGVASVDQISVEVAPEAPLFALVAGPSMMTLATLLRSWPVTTRRIGGSFDGALMFFLTLLGRSLHRLTLVCCHGRTCSGHPDKDCTTPKRDRRDIRAFTPDFAGYV